MCLNLLRVSISYLQNKKYKSNLEGLRYLEKVFENFWKDTKTILGDICG